MKYGAFTDANGKTVNIGDTVEYKVGARHGIVKDIFQDGDVTVEFLDNGERKCVKWIMVCRSAELPEVR